MNEKRGKSDNHRKTKSNARAASKSDSKRKPEPKADSKRTPKTKTRSEPTPKSNRQAMRELHAAEKKRARRAKKGLSPEPERKPKRARRSKPAKRDSAPQTVLRENPTAVDQRHRHARRAPAPKRKTRARWKPALFILCLVALAGLLGGLYYGTDLFHVRDIEVTGCSHLNPDYIRALSGINRDTRFFGVNAGEVEKSLQSEFWVESVSIKRKLPLRLVIHVKERQPWASVPMVGRLFSVDVSGVVLEELPAADPVLPLILDLPPRAVTPGDSVEGEQFQTCVDVLLAMPAELHGRFASISSTPNQEVTLVTREGMQVIYGSPSEEETKNQAVKALLQDPGVNIAGLAYLDVSVPDHPVIKPR